MEQDNVLCFLPKQFAAAALLMNKVGEYQVDKLNDTPYNAITAVEGGLQGINKTMDKTKLDFGFASVGEGLTPSEESKIKAQVAWMLLNLTKFADDLGLLSDEKLDLLDTEINLTVKSFATN